MTALKRMFGLVLVGVWVCGCVEAKIPLLESRPMQEMAGQMDTSSCAKIRDNMERMLYSTFKGNLPRRMLKDILPPLIEPLLPTACLGRPGSDVRKWVTQATQHSLSRSLLPSFSLSPSVSPSLSPLSRRKRFIPGFFMMPSMPPMPKVKDPGDRPPPGMTRDPFKDLGDRPIGALFGMPGLRKIKDPGDHPPTTPPPGEAAPVNPFMSSMMAMMRMMNYNRQRAMWARALAHPVGRR